MKMQLIFMTGTIPPTYVKLYFQLLGRPDFVIFRLPSDRWNVSLHHIPAYRQPTRAYFHEDIVLRLIEVLNALPTATKGRILVFFPYTETIEHFADTNGYLWYHSKEGTKLRLQEVLQAWDSGPCNVLVASTAMAQGMDIADVRYVIVVDIHYGVSTLSQMMGRAGRDDEPSAAYFIGHQSKVEASDLNLFAVPGKECLRKIMMGHLDGQDYAFTCKNAPYYVQYCGICNPKSETHQMGSAAAAYAKDAAGRVEERCPKIRVREPAARAVQPLLPAPSIITRNASPGPSKSLKPSTNALKPQASITSSTYWSQESGEVSAEVLKVWDEVEAQNVQKVHNPRTQSNKGKVRQV